MLAVYALLEVAVAVAGGVVSFSAAMLLWRFHGSRRRARRSPEVPTYVGLTATVFAGVLIAIMAATTVLYVSLGLTPVDLVVRLGMRLPTTANRSLLLLGTSAAALLMLYALGYMVHAVRVYHFPPTMAPHAPPEAAQAVPTLEGQSAPTPPQLPIPTHRGRGAAQ